MRIHQDTEEKFRLDSMESEFFKWAYMLQVTAGSGSIKQDATKNIIDKTWDNIKNVIQNFVSPFTKTEETEARKEITEEEKTQFLEEMGKYKFSGLNEIMNAIKDKSQ